VLNGRPLSRWMVSALATRSSTRVPCFALMVGPGKIPLYPVTVVVSPGAMDASPAFCVTR
jgi:hypothetical protein